MENKKENKKGILGIVILSEALFMLMRRQPDYRGNGKTSGLMLLRRQACNDKSGRERNQDIGSGVRQMQDDLSGYRESNQREQSRCEAHEDRGYYRNHEL